MKNINYTDAELVEFLQHSNWIESEYGSQALEDAMQAWDYITNIEILTVEDVLEVHKRLMQNLNPRIAGQFRDVQVYVGGREGAPWQHVPGLIGAWVEDANTSVTTPGLNGDNIKVDHVEFEHIHPFEDGNGRTGRILMNWERVQAGLPLLIIHEGDEQLEYYKWFR